MRAICKSFVKSMLKFRCVCALLCIAFILSALLSGCAGISVDVRPAQEESGQSAAETAIEADEVVGEDESLDDVEDSDTTSIDNNDTDESDVDFDEENDVSENDNLEEVVNVPDEKIDVIYFMGQSNMSGMGGKASLAPEVPIEAGEEFKAFSDPTKLYPIKEPFGKTEDNPDGLSEKKNKGKKGSLASAFVNKYHELTGNKVIAVSIASGGKAMDLWNERTFFDDVYSRFKATEDYLKDNDIVPNKIYVIWMQGESDEARQIPGGEYGKEFMKFFYSLRQFDVDEVFVVTHPAGVETMGYMEIVNTQMAFCNSDPYFCLATTVIRAIGEENYSDSVHINQHVLNLAGQEAAKAAAYYTNTGRKPVLYNYMTGGLFIPEGSEDLQEDCIGPVDVTNINEMY